MIPLIFIHIKCFSTQNVCRIFFFSKLCTLLGPLALSFLRFLFNFSHFLCYWSFNFLHPFLLFLTIVIVGHWLLLFFHLWFYFRVFRLWLDFGFWLDWSFLLLFLKIEVCKFILDNFSVKIFILDVCRLLFNPFFILGHLIDFLLSHIGYLFIILEQEILVCIIDDNIIFIDLNLL